MKNRWSEKKRDGERWIDGYTCKIYRSRDRDKWPEDINVDIKR